MSQLSIVNQLNTIIESRKNNSLHFYDGDITRTIDVLKDIAPFGKIAVVYSVEMFNQYGELSTVLNNEGFKVINIVEKNNSLDMQNAVELFNLSSSIRAVLCVGSVNFALVTYYTSMRKIPVVYYVDSFDMLGAFLTRVCIKNNNKRDYVKVLPTRHIILDYDKIALDTSNLYKGYGYTENMFVSLIDYRIAGVVGNNNMDSVLFTLLKKAVLSCWTAYKYKGEKKVEIILNAYLLTLTANILSDGQLVDSSAVSIIAFLLDDEDAIFNVEIAKRILGFYELCFSKKYTNTLPLRNYFADAVSLGEILNTDNSKIIKGIQKNVKLYEENEQLFLEIRENLYKEVASLSSATSKMISEYTSLGGKQYKNKLKLNDAISISGFMPNIVNGMTLVKESGILD